MKEKSKSEVAQSCLTLSNPMDYSLPGYQAPPSMGFSRQEYWSGLPLPSSYLSLQGTFWLTFIVLFFFSLFHPRVMKSIHSFTHLLPQLQQRRLLVISTEQACQPGPCPLSPPPGLGTGWYPSPASFPPLPSAAQG